MSAVDRVEDLELGDLRAPNVVHYSTTNKFYLMGKHFCTKEECNDLGCRYPECHSYVGPFDTKKQVQDAFFRWFNQDIPM